MKKVTLYDVAKRSGVSPKTVSRVINAEDSVSVKTRELVESAISTLGYQPNIYARSLRTSKSYLLALLYDNMSPAYVLDLQTGIQPICEATGFNILIRSCSFESPTLTEDISALIDHSRADGLILSPPLSDHKKLLKYLDNEKQNYVRIAPIDTQTHSSFVTVDDKGAATKVTDYLISLGHRSIGFINGDHTHSAAIERLAGYKASLKNAGIPLHLNLIEQGDFSFESGEISAQRLLSLKTPPSAIFASNDYMAAGVMKTAHKMGLRIPQDLSLVGFDDAPVSRQIWPTITTVRQPTKDIASNSAELLIKKILNQQLPVSQLRFKCELVIRESTAAINTSN